MTAAARFRRILALGATFAVLLAGLTLAQAPAPAEAASNASVSASILKMINVRRVDAGMPKLKTHPAITGLAQNWAQKKANTGSTAAVARPTTIMPIDATYGTVPTDIGRQAAGPKQASHAVGKLGVALKLATIKQDDGVFTYGAVGFVQKGNREYAVLVMMSYPVCPLFTFTAPNPTIAGTVAVGSTLTARPGAWTAGTELSYIWWVGDVIASTESTFVPTAEQQGSVIRLQVHGELRCYGSTDRAVSKVIAAGTLTTKTPVVTGDRNVGETLTAITGEWLPGETSYSLHWLRNGAVIPEATNSSYELTPSDRGARIDVRVTGSAAGYSTSSLATATKALVDYPLLEATPTPTIAGEPVFGQLLTADAGSWEAAPVTLKFQWRANGAAIAGATKATFSVPATAVGKTVTVSVTGSKAGFGTTTRTSAPTAAVASLPLTTTTTPVIVGTPKVGATLKVVTGAWAPSPKLTYQWYRNGVPLKYASKSTYTLTTTMKKGNLITVRVTAVKPGYTSAALVSLPAKVR